MTSRWKSPLRFENAGRSREHLSAKIPGPRKRLPGRVVFRGRAFKVRIAEVRKSSGVLTTRETVEHPDSVAVVAVDRAMNVLLVRQWRDSVGKELLEIPAGGIEQDESPDDCVRRELREETGYLPRIIKKIGGFYSTPGFCTEYLYLYLATDLEYTPLTASDTDEIQVERIPLVDTLGLISTGQIEDAKSIAGLLSVLTFYKEEIGQPYPTPSALAGQTAGWSTDSSQHS